MFHVSIPVHVTLMNLDMERENVTAATSVGVANEDLLPLQPLTGKVVLISLHFPSGQ